MHHHSPVSTTLLSINGQPTPRQSFCKKCTCVLISLTVSTFPHINSKSCVVSFMRYPKIPPDVGLSDNILYSFTDTSQSCVVVTS